MIYLNRKKKQEVLIHYIYYVDGFTVGWQQNVNRREEVMGIGYFNQYKNNRSYNYKKKGYGNGMYRRIVELSRNSKK